MSKKKLFDEESDEEVSFKTENEYAKKYDNWRGKEEIHKLEQKYGSKVLSSDASVSSDSEDDSDEPLEVSEETEKQFLKTLALLKNKDPRIYDPDQKFFDDKEVTEEEKKPKRKSLTFDDSDEDDDDGNIFTIEKRAIIKADSDGPSTQAADFKKTSKDGKLTDYLTGKAVHIDDEVKQDLAPLKALWSDPKLNEGEAFLRDYILNKRYLEAAGAGAGEDRLRDDEELEEDEKRMEEQGNFERAYNFRFEEPDDEYLKRFPRTMNSIRPKDDRRSRKRAELRTRKEEDKRRKMEEIARLRALKRKEIREKIERIKEVTGNQELAFKEEDMDGEFDPEQHDRRMADIFDEHYYGQVDHQKPEFPDLDEELEIENWENYELGEEPRAGEGNEGGAHCEDDDFNMDADFDPKQPRAKLLEQIQRSLGKRRARKKKSKLARLLAREKPLFVPGAEEEGGRTYSQHMEEYYAMECEDVVGGDLPTRFKYREVVPNDFGLTVEEILLADDKELTQWVPLKRIVKYRPADVEKGDVRNYAQRAADLQLKRKVLPSLFKHLPEEPEIVEPVEGRKKKKKNKNKGKEDKQNYLNKEDNLHDELVHKEIKETDDVNNETSSRKRKKKHDELQNTVDIIMPASVEESVTRKKKKKHVDPLVNEEIKETNDVSNETWSSNRKKKHKELQNTVDINVDASVEESVTRKKKNKKIHVDPDANESNFEIIDVNPPKETTGIKQTEGNKNNSETNGLQNTEISKTGKKKKKNYKADGFVVEIVNNEGPSQATIDNSDQNKPRNGKKNQQLPLKDNARKYKRKLETDHDLQVPHKKKNKKFDSTKTFSKSKKDFIKMKNKQNKDNAPDNPFNKLSDERLKAYGLNPKKYRSFLKYKKF